MCVCKRSDEKYLAVRKIKWQIYVIRAGNMMQTFRRLVGVQLGSGNQECIHNIDEENMGTTTWRTYEDMG